MNRTQELEKIAELERFVKDNLTDNYRHLLSKMSLLNYGDVKDVLSPVSTTNAVEYHFLYSELNNLDKICHIIMDIVETELERLNIFVKNFIFDKACISDIFFDIYDEYPCNSVCFKFLYRFHRGAYNRGEV